MPDDIASQFQVRRPMLQHVAEALHDEIAELFADETLPAHIAFNVAATDDFLSRLKQRDGEYQSPLVEMPDQICGTIEVREFEPIARVELLLGQLLTVHSSRWQRNENGLPPSLHLTCVIPPQAMPEGWRSRSDLPIVFQLHVHTAEKTSAPKPNTIPLLMYPSDANAPFPLIMKGGGIKGLAYVGAIEELSRRYKFNWFVGTSAGAITAVLLGAGYTPQELRELMKEKDFRDFFDASWYAKPFNLIFRGGLHHGNAFTTWIDDLLAKKLRSHTRVRLSNLPHRVTVYACRRGRRTLKFDSLDNDADAAYAARCSMSIPLVFKPQADQGINTYDGGIHQNFPVEQLLKDHPNTPFISLFLGPEVYEPVRQQIIFDVFSIWTEGGDAEAVAQYRERTVIIDPRPIGTLDFDLTNNEKEFLLACGRASALGHLEEGSTAHLRAKDDRDALRPLVMDSARIRNRRKWIRRVIRAFIAVIILFVLLWSCNAVIRTLLSALLTVNTPPDTPLIAEITAHRGQIKRNEHGAVDELIAPNSGIDDATLRRWVSASEMNMLRILLVSRTFYRPSELESGAQASDTQAKSITSSILKDISQLKHLKTLEIRNYPEIDHTALKSISEMTSLTSLTISPGGFYDSRIDHGHLDMGLDSIRNLTNLTYLDLSFSDVGDGLGQLSTLSRLTEFNLAHTRVGDKQLKVVCGSFRNLKQLNLNSTPITNQGLDSIAKLEWLSNVDLQGTAITKLDALAPMKHLKGLNLEQTNQLDATTEIRRLNERRKQLGLGVVTSGWNWDSSRVRAVYRTEPDA